MLRNQKLAIAIPTFNRPTIIEENIRIMLPELREYMISVYISDDSENVETRRIVEKLREEYEHIYYRHNLPRLGHDKNFFAALEMPESEYVWYLGDSVYCEPGHLSEIFRILENDFDFVFINSYTPYFDAGHVVDNHDFIVERAWYLTLSGATIYGRRPRSMIVTAERKIEWKNFVQLGLVLEYCSENAAAMYWSGTPGLGFNKNKRSYWTKSAISVFVHDWSIFIRSFPSLFSPEEMNQVIRSHGLNTGLFGVRSLMLLRANGGLSAAIIRECKSDFLIASPTGIHTAYFIASLPIGCVNFLRKLVRGLKDIRLHKMSGNLLRLLERRRNNPYSK